MYRERMKGYYPEVIRTIEEFKAIIDSEYPEIEELHEVNANNISDAYLTTMGEDRVSQWESILGIAQSNDSTLDDRRDTVIARIRGQGKLNTELIKAIVKTFTGGDCKTWIEDSVLYVRLKLPRYEGKDFKIENLIREIEIKVPAHLGCDISVAYQYWTDVNAKYPSWSAARNVYMTWDDVLYDNQTKPNQLDYSKLDEFYLG